jgi:hypothetical protein
MSLKAFHVLFVCLAVFLCWGFAYWCLGSPAAGQTPTYQGVGAVSLLCGFGLIFYGFKFLQKMKRLDIR